MEKVIHNIKKLLFLFLIGILFLPYIQSSIHYFEEKPLKGAFEAAPMPSFSFANWFQGNFQEEQEKYITQNYGFHNAMVRLFNQIRYTFFRATNAQFMIIGKNDYLYGENYVRAYIGDNYIGADSIKTQVHKLKMLRDTLAKKQIELMVVLAPGKGSFIPENIPDEYLKKRTGKTNLVDFVKEFEAANFPFINFNTWFIQNRKTSKYPLYSKCGWHWSYYSQYLVGDSLLHFVEKLNNVDLPDIVLDSIKLSSENLEDDYDAGNLLNLIYKIPTYPMAVPYFHFNEKDKTKIKCLVIADSYYQNFWAVGLSKIPFDDADYWYYNKDVYSNHNKVPVTTDVLDLKSEIEKNKTIILLCTDGNYHQLGFGFIDQAFDLYFGPKKPESEKVNIEKLNGYIKSIKENPKWLELIKEKAKKNNVDLETAIRLDAEYMIKMEGKNN